MGKKRKIFLDVETRSNVVLGDRHFGENAQLLAYAAGMDFGSAEASVLIVMGGDRLEHPDVILVRDGELMCIDYKLGRDRIDVDKLMKCAVKEVRPERHEKPRRDWEQRDRKRRK